MFVGLTAAIVQGGLTRIIVPRAGERATATFAMSVTATAYIGYALASAGWAIYALIAFSALGGLAQPALQGIMSRTMPADAQGELQGAIGAVMSISMVLGPPLMTQIFCRVFRTGYAFLDWRRNAVTRRRTGLFSRGAVRVFRLFASLRVDCVVHRVPPHRPSTERAGLNTAVLRGPGELQLAIEPAGMASSKTKQRRLHKNRLLLNVPPAWAFTTTWECCK